MLPKGFCTFQTSDGSKCFGGTPSIGLFNWYAYNPPDEILDLSESCHKIIKLKGKGLPGPYHPLFLSVAIGAIERNFGTSLHIPECVLKSEWYENLPEKLNDPWEIVQQLLKNNPKVKIYEKTCSDILRWIEKQGGISNLLIYD
jgi:hypothetical protein